jgi:hypothetical protein
MREIQAIIESKYQLKLKMVDIDIRTPNELSLFLNFLKNNLNDNQCILVKLLRTSKERKRYDNYSKGIVNSTPGHSFVFTKIKEVLYTLDPFSQSKWETNIDRDLSKLSRIWTSEQGYIHARFFIISGFENTFCKSINSNLTYDICNVIDDKYDEEDEDEEDEDEEDEEDEDEDEDEEGEWEKEKITNTITGTIKKFD